MRKPRLTFTNEASNLGFEVRLRHYTFRLSPIRGDDTPETISERMEREIREQLQSGQSLTDNRGTISK